MSLTLSKPTESKSIPLTYKFKSCFLNSFLNKRHYYKNKNLKLVYGSLGLNGWYEFGHKDWTLKDFKKKQIKHIWDAHAWLEDENGNVYDFAFKMYNEYAKINTNRSIKIKGLIEGMSKSELLKKGLTYVPASPDIQKEIFLSQYKWLLEMEDIILNRGGVWIGDDENVCILRHKE